MQEEDKRIGKMHGISCSAAPEASTPLHKANANTFGTNKLAIAGLMVLQPMMKPSLFCSTSKQARGRSTSTIQNSKTHAPQTISLPKSPKNSTGMPNFYSYLRCWKE